jgi:hypothetical protein
VFIHGLINDRPAITCIVGRKGSGKTQLALKLLTTPSALCGVYDRIILVSSTFKSQYESVWSKISPKGIDVYEELTDNLLQCIITRQQNREDNLLLVSDDLGSDWRQCVSQSIVNKFISNSRHLRISCVFLLQKLTQAPTIVRSNCDCFVAYQANSHLDQTALFCEVGSCDRRSFDKMFRQATEEQYSCFVASVLSGKLRFFKKFEVEIYPPS